LKQLSRTVLKTTNKLYLLLFLLLLPNKSILPQSSNFDTLVTTGIKQIYSINFSEAEVTFRKLMADYPDHPSGRFFLAMIDW
jgi:hypothetical protein